MEDAIAARGGRCGTSLRVAELDIAQALVEARRSAPAARRGAHGRSRRRAQPGARFIRMSRKDTRNCEGCHPKDLQQSVARKPAYAGMT